MPVVLKHSTIMFTGFIEEMRNLPVVLSHLITVFTGILQDIKYTPVIFICFNKYTTGFQTHTINLPVMRATHCERSAAIQRIC